VRFESESYKRDMHSQCR